MSATRIAGVIALAFLLVPAGGFGQAGPLRQGMSLMNASRPLEAERILTTIPESSPDYYPARILLGFLYLRRASLAEAEQAFRIVVESQPDSAPARLGLGMTLVQRGLVQQAAREFQRVLGDASLGSRAQVQWIQSLFLAAPRVVTVQRSRR